jgi:hypothetical protein
MSIELGEMLDSSEFSDEHSGWSKRGVKSLIKDSRSFHREILCIRKYIQHIRKKQEDLTITASILSAVGSSLTGIELAREVLSINRTRLVDPTFILIILSIALMIDLSATGCLVYLKVKKFDEEIQVGSECLQEYQYLCDEVESQLLRKGKYRSNMVEFMKRIHHAKEKLYYIQSTKLGMGNQKSMDTLVDMEEESSSYSTCTE